MVFTSEPIISEIEIQKVKEYLVLNVAAITLDKDIKAIEGTDMLMKSILAADLRAVQDRMIADLILLRKELKQLGIKIVEETRSVDKGLQAQYVCRGYERSIGIIPAVIRAMTLKVIAEYKNVDLTKAAP